MSDKNLARAYDMAMEKLVDAEAEIERLRKDWAEACKYYGEARARNAELLEAHHEIVEWARAYPLKAFPEPDFARAAELLKAGGITLDAISASNMRHVVTEVAKISRAAIAKAEGK